MPDYLMCQEKRKINQNKARDNGRDDMGWAALTHVDPVKNNYVLTEMVPRILILFYFILYTVLFR